MRPSPLARRWLDARHLVAGLSLVVIALALLAYWAWQASVRRHQVAIELLRSHAELAAQRLGCLLYTSPSPRDGLLSRMPSSA